MGTFLALCRRSAFTGLRHSAGRRRKRSWPEALKREIVAATFAPGSSVSIVARQYDVNANQVFGWRRRYREEARPPGATSSAQLIAVTITAERDAVAAPPSSGGEKIEIDIAGKYRVHIGVGFDGQALRRVLDVLERRWFLFPWGYAFGLRLAEPTCVAA